MSELNNEPVAEPVEVVEPEPEPVADSVDEPVVEPVAEPVAEPLVDPEPEPVSEPVSEPVLDQDENHLITASDLEEDEVKEPELEPNLWDSKELLESLAKDMDVLGGIRFKKQVLSTEVLDLALKEVLKSVGWDNYQNFCDTVYDILNGPRNGPTRVPFSVKTRDKLTNRMDFWLVRSFIHVDEENSEYKAEPDSTESFSKKTVLMSREFSSHLRTYCKDVLKDEVQFWVFTGSYKGKQHLDLTKFNDSDIKRLQNGGKKLNPDNLIMIQFKKKAPEVIIGKIKKSQRNERRNELPERVERPGLPE
jgi:hypothetical protein